jgi:hypothetical protein
VESNGFSSLVFSTLVISEICYKHPEESSRIYCELDRGDDDNQHPVLDFTNPQESGQFEQIQKWDPEAHDTFVNIQSLIFDISVNHEHKLKSVLNKFPNVRELAFAGYEYLAAIFLTNASGLSLAHYRTA